MISGSGLLDIAGVEIKVGDTVKLTINQQYGEPLVFEK